MREHPSLPRVLSRADACALGYTPDAVKHRLATGAWQRLLPRTLLTSDTVTWPDRLAAALCFAGDGALLSGAAALSLSALRCVARPANILVLVPIHNRTCSSSWVTIRSTARLPDRDPWIGPRRVPVARAVADHALSLRRLDDVRALLAEAVRRGLCDLDDVAAELAAGPRNGSAHLRVALAEVGAGAASAPEALAARLLRRGRIGGFEQNVRVDLPTGGHLVADFLWRELRAVLEIDSVEHHFNPADWRATMDRHLTLTKLGYSVVHRPPSALRDGARFVRDVRGWLRTLDQHAQVGA